MTVLTANTTNGSAVLASPSSVTGLSLGQAVSGTGIPAGAVITALSPLTISKAATATATGVTITSVFAEVDVLVQAAAAASVPGSSGRLLGVENGQIVSYNAERSWGITATHGALNRSLVMTSGAPTLTLSAAGAATALSGSPVTIIGYDSRFDGTPSNGVAANGTFRWSNNATLDGNCNYFRFLTDSADFELILNAVSNWTVNVKVGDQYVQAVPISSATGGVFRLRVTHSEKLPREITVTGSPGAGNVGFNGVTLSPTDTFTAPPILSPEVWGVLGDSMSVGGLSINAPSNKGGGSLADICMTALGVRRFVVDAVGGSGYVSGGGAFIFGSRIPTRLLAVNPKPTRILVVGGYNDQAFTQAAVQAAAIALFDQIQTALPGVKIIAATTVNPLAGDIATPAILAAVAARSSFVSAINAHLYITGTGRVGALTGVGNRDLVIDTDNVHPTPYGYTYLGMRMAQDIMALRAAA